MSIIPLSVAEEKGLTQVVHDDTTSFRTEQRETENKKFDDVFDRAYDQAEANEREQEAERRSSRGKGLDSIIADAMDQAEAKREDQEAFQASRSSRDAIHERYTEFKPNTQQTLHAFLSWFQAYRADPVATADAHAQSYLSRSGYALPERKALPAPPDYSEFDEKTRAKRQNNDKLDAAISDAIDRAGSEKAEFVASKAQRDALKQLWPDSSFAEQMAKIAQIDQDMHVDPLGTAGTLAALFGAPVTHQQQQFQGQVNGVSNEIAALQRSGHLPADQHLDINAIVDVFHSPGFRRNNDWRVDLVNAYRVAAAAPHYVNHIGSMAQQTLARMPPALARETQHVLLSGDPAFRAAAVPPGYLDTRGAQNNFMLAAGIAQQRLAQQAAVSRAKRVGHVRASVGGSSRGGKSLDAILHDAYARAGFE